jgi:hypothetical protein
MSNIIYSTPIRSSLPQERWRREADAAEARRAAVEAASRRRSQVAQELRQQSATTATERSVQAQLAALRSELAQQHEVMREAMVAYVVEEFAALRLELQRMLKRQVAEIERDFETKLAGLRMPRVRGTFAEAESYRQHDIVTRNGNSYIARKDQPGTLPGAGWQQLSMVGRTGSKGERGYSGERGPQGESGATFLCWKIDKRNYVAIPLMTNGKEGPRLYLRELFEQYHNETNQARERE